MNGQPLAPAMQRLLLVAAGLVFLAGLQLFVFPLRTADWFAWTIDVPMTAVFLGAAYWSSAVLEVAGARAGSWTGARLSVWTVLVFTTLTLVVTLVHLDAFHLGAEHPTSARLVTVGWPLVYAVVPVVMVVVGAAELRRSRRRPRSRGSRPPGPVRGLLVLVAVVLLGLGIALLVVPLEAARLWPWPLTELTARAVGAWLVGLGWAAAHARMIDDLPAIRSLGLTGSAFVALQVVALLRHGDALRWGDASAVGYLAVLGAVALVSAWILVASATRSVAAPRARAQMP